MAPKESRPEGLARTSVTVLASTAGHAFFWFVFVLVVARFGGPTARGALAFLMATPNLLHFASTFGLETASLFFGGKEPGLHPVLVSASIIGGLAFGSALGLVGWLVFTTQAQWVPAEVSDGMLALSLTTTPLITVHFLMVSALIGSGHTRSANFIRVSAPAASLVALTIATLAYGELEVSAAVAGFAGGNAAAFVIAVIAGMRAIGLAPIRDVMDQISRLLGYGIRAHVGKLADIATFRIDALILGATRGAAELGVYAAAVNLAEVALYLPTSVAMVLVPASVRRLEEAGDLTRRALALVVVGAGFVAVVVLLVAPMIVRLVFGADFAESAGPVRILAFAVIGMAVRRVLWSAVVARERQGLASAIAVATLVAILALDLLLIPQFGAEGAAWASAAAYWFGAALMVVAFRRIYPSRLRFTVKGVMEDVRLVLKAASPRSSPATPPHEGEPPGI